MFLKSLTLLLLVVEREPGRSKSGDVDLEEEMVISSAASLSINTGDDDPCFVDVPEASSTSLGFSIISGWSPMDVETVVTIILEPIVVDIMSADGR